MGIITTGSFAKLLMPGLNKIFGDAYNEWPEEWSKIFDTEMSNKAYEEDLQMTGFGLARVKGENASIDYDEESQGFLTRYAHSVLALGFMISREIYEDDQYGKIGKLRAESLAFSLRQTKEIRAANILNRAFTSTYAGGDGKELCATDHPNYTGGTQRNELSTAADLSEAALEQACIDISKFETDRGLKIAVMPKKLIIPTELVFEAKRILGSPYRVGTADNDVNAIKELGMIPEGVVENHYLTDTDAWFIKTNAQNGLKHMQRRAMQFAIDNDFDTEAAKFKATERYVFGWSNYQGIFGSPGAA
jgi:hypothetical protein